MIFRQKRGSLAGRTLRRGRLRTPVTMKSEDAPDASPEPAQTDEAALFAREIGTEKPQNRGNPATQRQEANGRKSYARPPARYGVFIGKDIERYLTQSRTLGNRVL